MPRSKGSRGQFDKGRDTDQDTQVLDQGAQGREKTVARVDRWIAPLPDPKPRTGRDRPGPIHTPGPPTDRIEPLASRVPAAVLIGVSGATVGQLFAVKGRETSFGRDERCTHPMAEPGISGQHMRIVHDDGHFKLVADSRTNEIYLNATEMEDHSDLMDGDLIGTVGLEFSFRTTYRPG